MGVPPRMPQSWFMPGKKYAIWDFGYFYKPTK